MGPLVAVVACAGLGHLIPPRHGWEISEQAIVRPINIRDKRGPYFIFQVERKIGRLNASFSANITIVDKAVYYNCRRFVTESLNIPSCDGYACNVRWPTLNDVPTSGIIIKFGASGNPRNKGAVWHRKHCAFHNYSNVRRRSNSRVAQVDVKYVPLISVWVPWKNLPFSDNLLNGHPRALLRLGNIFSNPVRFFSFVERGPNQIDTKRTQCDANNRGYTSYFCPPGRDQLGRKFLFSPLMLACGVVCILYAIRLALRGRREASVPYVFVGLCGIIFGAIGCLSFI